MPVFESTYEGMVCLTDTNYQITMTITDQDIKNEFDQFKNDAFGILLFGSYIRGDMTLRSDVDVCIVKSANDGLLRDINRKLWADMVPRIRDNQFTSVHERMKSCITKCDKYDRTIQKL